MSAVYKKEMGAYFHTLPAYIFMSGFLLCGGLLFSFRNIIGESLDLEPVWQGLLYALLFLSPVLTMRLIAAERADKTDRLLMTAPVSSWAVAAAKFLAALSVFAAALGISLLYPLVLSILGAPAWGEILTGYLGVLLFGSTVISICFFISSLMKRPVSAGLLAFGMMLFIMLIDMAAPFIGSSLIRKALLRAAPLSNAQYFFSGFLSVPSIVYFVSMTALFLFLTTRTIEHEKWSKGRRP